MELAVKGVGTFLPRGGPRRNEEGGDTIEKYLITKTLTKPPEAYGDAKRQPHVQVAF